MSTPYSNGTVAADQAEATGEGTVSDPHVIPGNSEFGNRYTRGYKLTVLRETDGCTKPGDLGRYLRRAGLTHTTLTCFRRQRAAGTLDNPQPVRRTRKPAPLPADDHIKRLMELERENRKLRRQLEQAEAVIDIQKKVSRLLEISLDTPESIANRRSG